MNDYNLLYNIINNINLNPQNIEPYNITQDTYNITEPYSYIEAIGISLIKLHNYDKEDIERMKRDEGIFKTKEERRKFIFSGQYIATRTYNKFNYTRTDESISKYVNKLIKNEA